MQREKVMKRGGDPSLYQFIRSYISGSILVNGELYAVENGVISKDGRVIPFEDAEMSPVLDFENGDMFDVILHDEAGRKAFYYEDKNGAFILNPTESAASAGITLGEADYINSKNEGTSFLAPTNKGCYVLRCTQVAYCNSVGIVQMESSDGEVFVLVEDRDKRLYW